MNRTPEEQNIKRKSSSGGLKTSDLTDSNTAVQIKKIHADNIAFKLINKEPITTQSPIYTTKQKKSILFSFLSYLRDFIVFYMPVKKLPSFIRKFLYGDISFIFFVHPRRAEDYYLGLPSYYFFSKLLSKKLLAKFAEKMPAGVLSSIVNKKNKGIVLASVILPENLLKNRRASLIYATKATKFCCKITDKKTVVGLGGWWPTVSGGGKYLIPKNNDNNIVITNGHTGTLISIYLMIKKIINMSNIDSSQFKIIILGSGKMGSNVANVLNNRVKQISLYDINEHNIQKTIKNLFVNAKSSKTLFKYFIKDSELSMHEILNQHHMAVCVTSNIGTILEPHDIPDDFICIDDSRPEAISRKFQSHNKIILEGGLLKIADTKTNYDYGFGIDENVFGCLAEAYAIAIDKNDVLKPTLGNVLIEEFEKTKNFYCENNITVGDFKTGSIKISDMKIKEIINNRIGFLKQQKDIKNVRI